MPIGDDRGHAATRGALHIALLDQVGFQHVFNGATLFADGGGKVIDTVRSTEPVTVEWEYQLDAPLTGLRVGMYLNTMRGEYVFTTFDTDDAKQYDQFGARQAGRYISSCSIPADFFNEGRYSLGVNASSFGVKRYFMDENALSFNVDISGAPGTQWPEVRQGPIRPRLDWKIEKLD